MNVCRTLLLTGDVRAAAVAWFGALLPTIYNFRGPRQDAFRSARVLPLQDEPPYGLTKRNEAVSGGKISPFA